jgi:hypothetical protein
MTRLPTGSVDEQKPARNGGLFVGGDELNGNFGAQSKVCRCSLPDRRMLERGFLILANNLTHT